MIKFIAADLDGTLLDSQKRLPRDFGEVIQRLNEKGIVFAPASGRQYYNLLKQFSPFGGHFMYIAENGAMVVKNGRPVLLDCLDANDAERIVRAVRDIPTASAIVCCDDCAFAEDDSKEEFIYNTVMYYERCRSVDNLPAYCHNRNICKIAIFDETDAEKNVYGPLRKISDSDVILSGSKWVDVMKPGVSKGSAIRHIQKRYGWKKEECMAFGDYLNDCEMLDACHYSYAMKNAHPGLKAHANFCAPSNDQCGVVNIIKKMLTF